MMFRKVQDWAKCLISLNLVGYIAWSAVVVGMGSLLLLYFIFQGKFDNATNLIVCILAGATMLGFLAWMTVDARKQLKRVHHEHLKEAKPEPNGDMSNVANLPNPPPWMGRL